MLYDFIGWMACPNLLVKSQIVSSSCLRIVCKELMFLFYRIEQRYCDMNATDEFKTHLFLSPFFKYISGLKSSF